MIMKEKNSSIMNVFVYILIIIFIILILAPPVARIVFSTDSSSDNINSVTNSDSLSTATALTCRREVVVGTMLYNITITSNYGDDVLNKVTFVYELPEVVDYTVTENSVLTEIETLRNSGLVTESTTDYTVTFVLDKDTKEANSSNTSLDYYFQPLETQTTNLESLGYSCSTLTA